MAVPPFVAVSTALLFALFSAWYTRSVVGNHAPGISRFVLHLPVVALNCCLPFLVSAENAFVYLRLVFAYLIAWLGTQKGIGFCLNRGPLATDEARRSFMRFAAIYLLSLYPARENVRGMKKLKEVCRLGVEAVVKAGLLLAVFSVFSPDDDFNKHFHIAIIHAFSVYLFLAFILNVSSFIGLAFFDVTSIDSFNYPFLATSLSDFWGHRWNIMTSKIFRSLSYDIVVDGSLVKPQGKNEKRDRWVPEWRRAVGVFAVFGLSGLTHVFCFWYMFGQLAACWFAYFVLQAPLLLLERHLQLWSAKRLGTHSMPSWVSIPVVFCVNLYIGRRFFLQPLRDVGALESAIQLRNAVLGS